MDGTTAYIIKILDNQTGIIKRTRMRLFGWFVVFVLFIASRILLIIDYKLWGTEFSLLGVISAAFGMTALGIAYTLGVRRK
jgi:hypothetical protein